MIFTGAMPRRARDGTLPSWNALYEVAAAQGGYFSLDQARAAGYSPQLLQHHVRGGKLERSHRGVLRLIHYPSSDREDLVPAWLWSKCDGGFGLQTALAIHQLSDVLPRRNDILVPTRWSKRRVEPPRLVNLVVEDVLPSERQWHGPVPVTTPARTLRDCFKHHVPPDLVEQALEEAVDRQLVSRTEARALRREAARATEPRGFQPRSKLDSERRPPSARSPCPVATHRLRPLSRARRRSPRDRASVKGGAALELRLTRARTREPPMDIYADAIAHLRTKRAAQTSADSSDVAASTDTKANHGRAIPLCDSKATPSCTLTALWAVLL